MARVLVIEDEADLAAVLEYNLKQAGLEPLLAATGGEGLRLAETELPDLVLLDLMLPDRSGNEVCRALKAQAKTRDIPVIMLTAKGEEIDRVVGFEIGAEDYVTKPFSVRELLLRLRAVLRRAAGPREQPGVDRGLLRIDRAGHRVWVEGREVSLTRIEYSLLTALVDQEDRALTRAKLLDRVWGDNVNVTDRTVDTHVTRLRTKLGAAGRYVQTVRGHGYRFSISDRPGPGALAQT